MSAAARTHTLLFARLSALLLLSLVAAAWLASRGAPEEVVAYLPWLLLSLFAYFVPFLVARLDIFSPPGLIGIQGTLALASVVANAWTHSGLELIGLGYIPFEQRVDLVRSVCMLHTVSQAAYLLGYALSSGRIGASLLPQPAGRPWQSARLWFMCGLLLLVFALCFGRFHQQVGGSVLDLSTLSHGKAALREMPTATWMIRGAMLGALPVLLLTAAGARRRSSRLLFVAFALYGAVGLALMRLGPRGPVVAVGLMALMVVHYTWRRLPALPLVGVLLCVVIGVQILGEYRLSGKSDTEFAGALARPVMSLSQHEDDRQRLTALAVVMRFFPDRRDYLMGESFRALAVFWIPQWLWPGKYEHLKWRDTAIVRNLTGAPLPTPLKGVLYANFGWFGAVLGMGLFGAFHRGLYRYLQRSKGDAGSVLIYTVVLTSFRPTALGLAQSLQYVLPAMVAVYWISRPGPKALLSAPKVQSV